MKGQFLTLLRIAIAVVFMIGCGETKNEIKPKHTPKINLSEESLSSELLMKSESQSVTVKFTSNVPWYAMVSTDWVSLSSYSGKAGNESILISVSENKTFQPRTAVVTISDEEKKTSALVRITQDAMTATLMAKPESLSFSSSGGKESIILTTNASWMISRDVDWVILESEEGQRNSIIKATILENRNLTSRSGTIMVSTTDGEVKQAIPVQQGGADATLLVSPTNLTFSAKSESKFISIISNTTWTVVSSDSWLKLNSTGGSVDSQLSVSVDANELVTPRTATIVFLTTDGNVTAKVEVIQNAADIIFTVNKTEFDVNAIGETFSVKVKHNINYRIASSPDWVRQTDKTTESDVDTYTFKVEANTRTETRDGDIVFHNDNGDRITVSVKQDGADVSLSANTADMTFTANADTKSLSVMSNTTWTATSSNSWVKLSSTNGSGDSRLAVTVDANTVATPRSATITLKTSDGSITVTINVSQEAANPFFSIDKQELSAESAGATLQVIVIHNIDYEISSMPDWICFSKKVSSGNTDTYTISVYRNSGYKREGQIVFRYNGFDNIVTIKQSGSKKDGGNEDTTTGGKITLE